MQITLAAERVLGRQKVKEPQWLAVAKRDDDHPCLCYHFGSLPQFLGILGVYYHTIMVIFIDNRQFAFDNWQGYD